ncbi:hypothetical protein D3C71_1464150 [compost metagenome]
MHDTEKQGLVSPLIQIAKTKGISAYVGDGANRWPAGHVTDMARVYRLALEKHLPGARWNAVAEEGITMREMAETIGAGLGVPVVSITSEEAVGHFGPFGPFVGIDMPASSTLTREQLGWEPTGPGLIEDLRNMDYGVFGVG